MIDTAAGELHAQVRRLADLALSPQELCGETLTGGELVERVADLLERAYRRGEGWAKRAVREQLRRAVVNVLESVPAEASISQ